jgi:NDP-sugar pyrophosphorylase family protein
MRTSLLTDIPALILAGGLGTRLRGAAGGHPKVLAPVGGKPFLSHVLERLARTAIRRVVLLTGHRGDEVQRTLGARHGSLELSYVREAVALGTGGAIRNALEHVPERTLLILNGDSYCGVDLEKLASFHRRGKGDVSMVVTRAADTSRFGQVQYAALGRNRITGFVEKVDSVGPGWINAGIYVAERGLLQSIPKQACALERDCLPRWTAAQTLLAYPTREAFIDIGTPASYAEAEGFFAAQATQEAPRALSA